MKTLDSYKRWLVRLEEVSNLLFNIYDEIYMSLNEEDDKTSCKIVNRSYLSTYYLERLITTIEDFIYEEERHGKH